MTMFQEQFDASIPMVAGCGLQVADCGWRVASHRQYTVHGREYSDQNSHSHLLIFPGISKGLEIFFSKISNMNLCSRFFCEKQA